MCPSSRSKPVRAVTKFWLPDSLAESHSVDPAPAGPRSSVSPTVGSAHLLSECSTRFALAWADGPIDVSAPTARRSSCSESYSVVLLLTPSTPHALFFARRSKLWRKSLEVGSTIPSRRLKRSRRTSYSPPLCETDEFRCHWLFSGPASGPCRLYPLPPTRHPFANHPPHTRLLGSYGCAPTCPPAFRYC